MGCPPDGAGGNPTLPPISALRISVIIGNSILIPTHPSLRISFPLVESLQLRRSVLHLDSLLWITVG